MHLKDGISADGLEKWLPRRFMHKIPVFSVVLVGSPLCKTRFFLDGLEHGLFCFVFSMTTRSTGFQWGNVFESSVPACCIWEFLVFISPGPGPGARAEFSPALFPQEYYRFAPSLQRPEPGRDWPGCLNHEKGFAFRRSCDNRGPERPPHRPPRSPNP